MPTGGEGPAEPGAAELAGDAAATGADAPAARPSPAKAPPLSDPDRWLWPAEGRLLSRFQANDPARNGIDIGGEEGQAVLAAATGEVVYSGSGLIGYGELIIVKHSDRMLSAYAHNRRRLVAEGQRVAAGEQLAEMGRNDRNQPMLHFEIRVNGTPQDPLKYLPRR
jgi:lipoprotein NlpD